MITTCLMGIDAAAPRASSAGSVPDESGGAPHDAAQSGRAMSASEEAREPRAAAPGRRAAKSLLNIIQRCTNSPFEHKRTKGPFTNMLRRVVIIDLKDTGLSCSF